MKSNVEHITAETMILNEVAPQGFCAEPRSISQEVLQMRRQVEALCDAVLQLVEVQREANKKLEEALHPIKAA